MRPKKKILCVDSEEKDLSVLSFLLVTHQYKVLGATCSQDAMNIFSSAQVDLVIANVGMSHGDGGGVKLVEKMKRMSPHIPIILLDNTGASVPLNMADAMVARKNCSPFELLERIKVMSARKRGPRPKNKILDNKAQPEHTLSAGNILNA